MTLRPPPLIDRFQCRANEMRKVQRGFVAGWAGRRNRSSHTSWLYDLGADIAESGCRVLIDGLIARGYVHR